MSLRKALAGAVVALIVVLAAGPAWGHSEMRPTNIPIAKPNFVTVLAANESKSALTGLTLTAPDGVSFGAATRQPR